MQKRKWSGDKDQGHCGLKETKKPKFFIELQNVIEGLVGLPSKNPQRSKETIKFYQNLYTQTKAWRPIYNTSAGPIINEEDNNILQSVWGTEN